MPDEDVADLFAIPDFWKSSTWLEQSPLPQKPSGFFSLEILGPENRHVEQGVGSPVDEAGFFKRPPMLPPLAVDELHASHVLKTGDAEAVLHWTKPAGNDIWLSRTTDLVESPEFRSWRSFNSEHPDIPAPLFITEAGPGAFDALLALRDPGQCDILEPAAYCGCLLALALGRDSVLFSWDDRKKTFAPELASFRISGASKDVLQGIHGLCLDSGNASRFLKAFVDRVYSAHTSASRVALANAVGKLLLTVQSELGSRGKTVRSLIQLQAVVAPVRSLFQYFRSLVVRLSKSASDEQLLSLLFEEARAVEYGEGFLRDAVREVLKAVSKPWTDFVQEWMGLAPETGIPVSKDGPGKSFVKVEKRVWIDDMGFELEEPDYFLDDEKVPSFAPGEVAQSIFETGRNLRFLRASRPDHPLSDPGLVATASPPLLQWQFEWESIARVERKALAYEQALSQAVERAQRAGFKPGPQPAKAEPGRSGYELEFFGKDAAHIERQVLASMAALDQPLPPRRTAAAADDDDDDVLGSILRQQLFQDGPGRPSMVKEFTPPWSLLPLLSFGPIVEAQARVVNRECTRLLFKAHGLREHLALLRDYQLLGNGVFCSRLSHALFDPEADTAERKTGAAPTSGIMGLRLGNRDNWPPASSELRLALMGVLSESYQPSGSSEDGGRPPHGMKQELPGDLSFAVRDLTPEEMDKCMDPDSIEALDFLRLSYKPPAALMAVVTPMVLAKYDAIFKLLLRVQRIVYVVNQLFREARRHPDVASARFRVEAHHFVCSITAYFFDSGVAMPWLRFDAWLVQVQADLDAPWSSQNRNHSPDRLCEHHEHVLDEIMEVLLLRKRQQPVLRLLEEILGLVLDFAKASSSSPARRQAGSGLDGSGKVDADDDSDKPRVLYAAFRKKVEVFMAVCRGLSEPSDRVRRAGAGGTRPQGAEDTSVARLLLMLDMTGYYARK